MSSVVRALLLKIQSAFNEYPSLAYEHDQEFRGPSAYPVFIIGAPRTGSTLLYQLMIESTQLAFVSNLMALAPEYMLSIAKHTRRWMNAVGGIRESDAGYVPGLFRPSEAGAIMRKWFAKEVGVEERQWIRNTVIRLSEILEAPFVSKNVFNSLRLSNISSVFPEARFVYIAREPLFTAQSILLARRDKARDDGEWLGPKPAGYQNVVKQEPLYQVIWQVKEIEKTITEFLRRHSSVHLEVSYEEFCQRPQEKLELIADCLGLKFKNRPEVDRLLDRNQVKLSKSEWSRLSGYYSHLY